MTPEIKPLVAGNWKMNGTADSLGQLRDMARQYSSALNARVDLMICPPATLLASAVNALTDTPIAIGGQDCHAAASGAHTGDISAEMLADCGARAVIVGHSERRADHGESDMIVRAKAQAAWRARIKAIVCVGETRQERDAGKADAVVSEQLAGSVPDGATSENTVIAYEPVWAIGTGLTPTVEDVEAMHAMIRARLADRFGADGQRMRILYGGSVKPDNAAALMNVANVDGALVGGASLKAADLMAISAVYA
ncbi:MAG: triose-phosphate isomerase [Rhodobiaceae bacterium]|nr:triose-phosphate isomerase [Rhodobiaceae bacterium]MCC0057516.1 triose-phosphate isomerase [Rhodobiaceae bacterium]